MNVGNEDIGALCCPVPLPNLVRLALIMYNADNYMQLIEYIRQNRNSSMIANILYIIITALRKARANHVNEPTTKVPCILPKVCGEKLD
jgi:hypothetical protein